ncbi:MAG: zf-HC2 domain-containing protein [Blastocatellia bacterium]
MALEQNNTALEFEAMLRRQLLNKALAKKSERALISETCDGFDADTANAYLENALGVTARTRYDAHLADCHACRLHVIQFSRLIQQPQTEPQFAPVIKPASIWSHWKSVAAEWTEWLGFSSWQQGWATAGVAAAILIGVVSVQLWRQDNQAIDGNRFANTNNSTPSALTTSNVDTNGNGELNSLIVDRQRTTVASNIPKPEVSPHPGSMATGTGAGLNSFAGSNGAFDINPIVPPSPPPTVANLATSFASREPATLPAQPVIVAQPLLTAPASIELQPSESVVAAHIAPLASDNPMAKKSKKPEEPKASPNAFTKAMSFLPTRKPATERKLEETPVEENAPKVLAIRRRDKVFNYQSGFWVDSAYKSEMAWRVTKLVIDSDEYKQLLAAEPLLKEYFAHGPAIVMWKDKIYKAVAK